MDRAAVAVVSARVVPIGLAKLADVSMRQHGPGQATARGVGRAALHRRLPRWRRDRDAE